MKQFEKKLVELAEDNLAAPFVLMCRAWDILVEGTGTGPEGMSKHWRYSQVEFEEAFAMALREFGFEGNRQAMYKRYCG